MVLNSVRKIFRVKDLVYGAKRSTRLCFIKQFQRIYIKSSKLNFLVTLLKILLFNYGSFGLHHFYKKYLKEIKVYHIFLCINLFISHIFCDHFSIILVFSLCVWM